MKIKDLQDKIDLTEYIDLKILDFNINYFGDEISMYIYNDDETSWKLTFLTCFKVQYETDANWRRIPHVKDMISPQLGYFGQDITVSENKEDTDFVNIEMDLTIMLLKFSCKDVRLEKLYNKDLSFFWQKNKDMSM